MEHRTTVLYVDDNPRSSRLLAGVLEECGFRVTVKVDPTEALALCRRASFEVALLDYEMPAMSGSRLAREIKSLVPDLPVVLLSGRRKLPSPELEFVNAHFGFGTSLDDLLWTMRILATPKVVVQNHGAGFHSRDHHFPRPISEPLRVTESRWSDST